MKWKTEGHEFDKMYHEIERKHAFFFLVQVIMDISF